MTEKQIFLIIKFGVFGISLVRQIDSKTRSSHIIPCPFISIRENPILYPIGVDIFLTIWIDTRCLCCYGYARIHRREGITISPTIHLITIPSSSCPMLYQSPSIAKSGSRKCKIESCTNRPNGNNYLIWIGGFFDSGSNIANIQLWLIDIPFNSIDIKISSECANVSL